MHTDARLERVMAVVAVALALTGQTIAATPPGENLAASPAHL